ncbi:site-specific integrase [Paenibacillus elgii]|nr:site-specific integrase [Paenibacillus elgii]
MNELLQISYDKDCCVVTFDKSMDPPRKNYIFRLIPKGREEAENYYMPEDVFKFMSEILKTLKDSYKSDTLPDVEFRVNNRKHLMSQNKKYIFQYQNQHINEFSINAILRFLLHGIVVQTADGSQVVFKAHLLRHAFATHAAQTEKIPVDIVKTLLHQRDIEVTTYYSAPTKQQISSSIQTLHENWVSYIDIQKGILRAPDELKDMFEEYREKVGTLSKVVGGICTIDSVCPTKMACVGCGAKVPRPEFKEEILAYFNWADESEKRFEKQGLPLEAKKMKIAKNRAKHELDKFDLSKNIKETSYMNRESDSPTIDWLHEVYEKKRRRAFELGKQATDRVSHRAVAQKSKEIDPDGIGIHPNTILSNKELHEYISQHSTSKSSKARKAPRMPQEELSNIFKQVKEDRDIERVRRRYMKLSKSELVELLIQSEQYIAQNNKLWLKGEFEKHQ